MFYDENRLKAEVRLNELGSQDLNDAIKALNFPENSARIHLSNFIQSNYDIAGNNGDTQSQAADNEKLIKELDELKERNKAHLSRIRELKEEINLLKTTKQKTVSKRK